MNIQRLSEFSLRTDYFKTKEREQTKSFSVGFTNTAADPRIDIKFMDFTHCKMGAFGVYWHYLVRTDGIVQVGRDPRTISSRVRNINATLDAIHIGVVGGLDPATGERINSSTPEQDQAVEELMQRISDHLQLPLEVHDSREVWVKNAHQPDPDEAYQAQLDAAESNVLHDKTTRSDA